MSEKKGKQGFASMDPEKQRAIAVAGGKASRGNFAGDRARAVEMGRKGGKLSRGNFAHRREAAREAGRKGGRMSPGRFTEGSERAKAAGRAGGAAGHAKRRLEALNSHASDVPSSTDFA